MTSSTKRVRVPCLVCDADSVGTNFGVPTCMPCKAFFRRNAVKLGNFEFICLADGACRITHTFRGLCNCCRLEKCFRVGMRKELILSDAQKQQRRRIIEYNRQRRDQLAKIKSLALIRPSNLLRSRHSQSRCLSSLDQILLTNISSAYERTCIVTRNNTCQYFPSKVHSSIHTLFNEYNDRHLSLIEYFKLIPEFIKISMDDEIRLIRNNFSTMLTLNESTNTPDDCDILSTTLKNVFGVELAVQQYRSIESIRAYRHDPILIKLILIVQSLSSGTNRYRNEKDMHRIYDDTKIIFAGQNIYAELLWKYIILRSPSEEDAVKFFNKLILDLLVMVDVSFMTETFLFSFAEEIEKMEPLLQSILPVSKETIEINNYDIDAKSICHTKSEHIIS